MRGPITITVCHECDLKETYKFNGMIRETCPYFTNIEVKINTSARMALMAPNEKCPYLKKHLRKEKLKKLDEIAE